MPEAVSDTRWGLLTMTIERRRQRWYLAVAPALLVTATLLSACTGGSDGPTRTGAPTSQPDSAAPRSAAGVAVYPTAGSKVASPQTQISLRGVAPSKVGTVTVTGSRSGPHPGTLRADSDGDGASFFPARPFTAGEHVTVTTSLDVVGGRSGRYSFTVARPTAFPATQHHEAKDPSAVQHFHSAPSVQPPTYTITHGSISSGGGDVFVAPRSGPGQDGPMIVDAAGNLVWFGALPNGVSASDFREQSYEGQPVLTWWQGSVTATGQGIGEDVIYDDSYQQIATVRAGNGYHADLHDFTLTPDNTALITAYQPVRWDLSAVGGPKDGIALDAIMQEIDVATGNVLDEWHALDHVSLADSYADATKIGQKKQPDYDDFFHINSLDKSAAGDLLISGRATHTIYDVEPVTGDVIWRLGGKHSSFTGDGNDFSSQHDSKWASADTVSLFDNAAGVGKATSKSSSGMLVKLDLDTHTATLQQRFTSSDVAQATSQGNTQLLPGGDVFVGWGAQWELSQFAQDGTLVFEAALPKKDSSYRAYRFPWSGHPLGSPSAAISADGATVYASWNGATEVASWRVLAGASAAALKPVATARRQGFETSIPAGGAGGPAGSVVEVQALDQAGHVLSTSAPVHAD